MHKAYWEAVWATDRFGGFHSGQVHPYLQKYWPTLALSADRPVFVPLAGKSLDMTYLADAGHSVIGNELSPIAVEDFFRENGMVPDVRATDRFNIYSNGRYRIFQGDFFELTPEVTDKVVAAFDRAALIALPPEMRPAYAEHFAALMPSGSQTLLFSFAYDQSEMQGPPFSVMSDEVEALYRDYFEIDLLQSRDITKRTRFSVSLFLIEIYRLVRR